MASKVLCPCEREFQNIIAFNNHRRVCKVPIPSGDIPASHIDMAQDALNPDSGVHSFQCDGCGNKYKHAASLKWHKQSGCFSASSTASKSAAQDLKFPCPFCGKIYLSYQGLCRHKKSLCSSAVATPSEPAANECSCGRSFSSFAGLRQHMRKAHPEQYFSFIDPDRDESTPSLPIAAEAVTSIPITAEVVISQPIREVIVDEAIPIQLQGAENIVTNGNVDSLPKIMASHVVFRHRVRLLLSLGMGTELGTTTLRWDADRCALGAMQDFILSPP
ncbi:hypothetical protein Zmor_003609 [Zophobas morio]|uniref:C2H2-type domain-containing protein n=1 Tax=Zophobas morio TaxID=2755281 RepID=A0AA38HMF9_9CUCU|nr:hypothetical protein Zmor_003609 [Zophobas morio]